MENIGFLCAKESTLSKILLVDVDRIVTKRNLFPNLALMKLSAWHKDKGDEILPLNFVVGNPDLIYASCVFEENARGLNSIPLENIKVGGSGFKMWDTILPDKIEHIYPDYSLYGYESAMGFTSRGCHRKCPFCIVPLKEGPPQAWSDIEEFWKDQGRIILLDPNLLSASNWRMTLDKLASLQVKVSFNQGLDIRLVTGEVAYRLSKVNNDGQFHFAWDLISTEKAVRSGLDELKKVGISSGRCMFFVLVGFNTTPEEDLYRIKTLRGLGVDPFVMPFKRTRYTMDLARWVNHKAIFRSVSWEDYRSGARKNHSRDFQLEIRGSK